MKNLKAKNILFSLLAMMTVAIFLTSCSKEEAEITQDVFTTTETLTYNLSVPEGITAENTVEWFNQLSEEEIEEYTIEDFGTIESRGCASWSSWSGWYIHYSGFSCFSLVCPNSQSQSTVIRKRSRVRECSSGTQVQSQYSNTSTCRPAC